MLAIAILMTIMCSIKIIVSLFSEFFKCKNPFHFILAFIATIMVEGLMITGVWLLYCY